MALLVVAWQAAASAHDIPFDVTVQTVLKPDGQRLRLAVRVPLAAMRDMDYPRPPGAKNADLFDLARADRTLRDAATLWISDYLDLYENGEKLPPAHVVAVRAALQSDRSFASYDEAIAHLTGPGLPEQTEFFWSQGLLDVLFEYPIHSDQSRFSINPRLARLGIRTLTVLRFLPPDGTVRGFEFNGDPGLVRLDPGWREAAQLFVALGFRHILDGPEYLLFLVCLVLPFRGVRALAAVVTAFAVAHSITLIASAYGLAPDALWFPPLITTLIAASVLYLALEDIVFAAQNIKKPPRSGLRRQIDPTASARQAHDTQNDDASADLAISAVFSGSWVKRRWLATFAFGLVYGFGFGFALRPALQLAGSHVLASVLSFNLGIELGQFLAIALIVPALALLFRALVGAQVGTIVLAALAGHTAWHWTADRVDVLRKFHLEWPVIDAAFLAGALRWTMLLVVGAGLYWLMFGISRVKNSEV